MLIEWSRFKKDLWSRKWGFFDWKGWTQNEIIVIRVAKKTALDCSIQTAMNNENKIINEKIFQAFPSFVDIKTKGIDKNKVDESKFLFA